MQFCTGIWFCSVPSVHQLCRLSVEICLFVSRLRKIQKPVKKITGGQFNSRAIIFALIQVNYRFELLRKSYKEDSYLIGHFHNLFNLKKDLY